MRRYVGLWDRLFGQRVTIETRGRDGAVVRRRATKRWLEHAETTGQIEDVSDEVLRPRGGTADRFDAGDALVAAAKINAAEMRAVTVARFPDVCRYAQFDQWEHFVTVAGVGVAHGAIDAVQDPARRLVLQRSVEVALSRYAPDACATLLDFQRFVARNTGPEMTRADAAAAWVVWNVAAPKAGPPTRDEWAPAAFIATVFAQVFAPWWDGDAARTPDSDAT